MLTRRQSSLLAATVGLTTVCAVAIARSQTGGPVWDTSQLPETKGSVKQYTLTPRGDVDGLILTDGTEVKLPPHLTGQVVFAIRPGDNVTIRGIRSRALPLVRAASATNDASGATVVDNGPDGPARAAADQTISGKIVAVLHGARGEANGALFDNGTVLRLPPPEFDAMQAILQPGLTVFVRGALLESPLGRVIDARAIGPGPDRLTELQVPPPPGPTKRPR